MAAVTAVTEAAAAVEEAEPEAEPETDHGKTVTGYLNERLTFSIFSVNSSSVVV